MTNITKINIETYLGSTLMVRVKQHTMSKRIDLVRASLQNSVGQRFAVLHNLPNYTVLAIQDGILHDSKIPKDTLWEEKRCQI